ncbi:MAG: type II toxin-antitoxin system RelB/DinJ family antitoxin [Peptoanaerobacter stomatis]|uniref:type II toxin-antitoxin system RelB/DinJ family antitoxin n=1 Tax=Peptoanaerobacter stomatis TaxID=796937 RepID=UPI003FA0D921
MERASITVKLDKQVKIAFNNICEEIGLNMNSVLNAYILKTIRERGVSFYADDDYDDEDEILKRIEEIESGNAEIVSNGLRKI